MRQFYGTDIPDTTSGFRAYSARAAMKQVCADRMIAFGQAGKAPTIKCVGIDEFASFYATV